MQGAQKLWDFRRLNPNFDSPRAASLKAAKLSRSRMNTDKRPCVPMQEYGAGGGT
jgi:hypothetical protein